MLSDYTAGLLLLQDIWQAMHLMALLRHCAREGFADLAAQQATARLRHVQDMSADKAFFEAGGGTALHPQVHNDTSVINELSSLCSATSSFRCVEAVKAHAQSLQQQAVTSHTIHFRPPPVSPQVSPLVRTHVHNR